MTGNELIMLEHAQKINDFELQVNKDINDLLLSHFNNIYFGDCEPYDILDEQFERKDIAEYVKDNFDVDEVFDEDTIKDCLSNNYDLEIDEMFDEWAIKDYVLDNYSVGDIFDTDEIITYMKDNYDVEDFVDFNWKY